MRQVYPGALRGTTIPTVDIYKCDQWQVTSVNGEISLVAEKPSVGAGGTVSCARYIKSTTLNRWDS